MPPVAQPDTARLSITVHPRSSRRGISPGSTPQEWSVRVTAPALEGRANQAALELLAEALEVARSRLEIISGPHRRRKLIQVAGLSQQEAERRLQQAAEH